MPRKSCHERIWSWFATLSNEPSRAILFLLALVVVLALVAVAAFAVSNNVAFIGLIGVIIGAVFGILGTIINAIWLDPVRRKQEQGEKETRLRKAIYAEIYSVTRDLDNLIRVCKSLVEGGIQSGLKSDHKQEELSLEPITFRVYDRLTTEPIDFYQLDDANEIDLIHVFLRETYTVFLNEFECVSFDNVEDAQNVYDYLKASFIGTLRVIDRVFAMHSELIKKLEDGHFMDKWAKLRGGIEKEL